MTVALVHDWLTGMRGGEKCLESLCRLFPGAPIHTLLFTPERISAEIRRHPINCSYLQGLPGIHRCYRYLLPIFPDAIERFDLSEFDLIVSSSHCVAKGIRRRPEALHISYCHTPMRYLYEMKEAYMPARLPRTLIVPIRRRLERWDRRTAARVDLFVANSQHVRGRIRRTYGRDAEVVYPPVDTGRFGISDRCEDYFLIVSALVPYKRIDLAVRAFNALGRRLLIVGDGPERQRLERLAGPCVGFLGWQPDERLPDFYAHAAGFVLPGVEDFGIAALESQASGRPVIALRAGGAIETVLEGRTGRLFWPQTVEALVDVVRRFDPSDFNPETLREFACGFDRSVFEQRMAGLIEAACEEHRTKVNRGAGWPTDLVCR